MNCGVEFKNAIYCIIIEMMYENSMRNGNYVPPNTSYTVDY